MDKRHIKGQSAIEFMILAGFLLFTFILILGVVSDRTSYTNKKRDIILGEDLVTKAQKEINLAARVLDGYSRNFSLPKKLGNKEYNITIMGKEIIVSTEKQDFWRVIPSVVGNLTKGTNKINKTNGSIYLN